MKTIISINTIAMKTLSLLFMFASIFACSNAATSNDAAKATATTEKTAESISITGIVTAITLGKDGYSADVQTDNDGIYSAMVSMVNLGGPEKFQSCEVTDRVTFKGIASVMNGAKKLMVQEIVSISTTQTQMLIGSKSFKGIKMGDAIAKYSASVKKTKLKTAEGDFDVYEIKDFENNAAGYFEPSSKNKLLVGNITVETVKAQTEKGIKVGDTFKDLQKVFPNIEVHGSEIEGRTYATANGISYRLNMPNFKYEVDEAKIPATTKIMQILIEE